MKFAHRLSQLTRRSRGKIGRSNQLRVEPLENRRVLASFSPLPATADGSPGSLRDAIVLANSNGEDDVITLAAGTYTLTATQGGEGLSNTGLLNQVDERNPTGVEQFNDLDITEPNQTLTIRGAGIGSTFLTAGMIDRVFHIHPDATFILEDVTIHNSHNAYDGGGLLNDGGTTTLRRVDVTDNIAEGEEPVDQAVNGGGGGVANWIEDRTGRVGVMVIEDSFIRNNEVEDRVGRGGGLYVRGGIVTLRNTIVENNLADGNADTFAPSGGGGIANEGELIIEDSIVRGNTADAGAGILNNGATTLEITRSEISGNTVPLSGTGGGGGIYTVGAEFDITDSYVHGNMGDNKGGAIWIDGGGANVYRSTIANNRAHDTTGQAGAIFNDGGRVLVENSTISGNVAYDTGGIYMNGGFLNMTFSTVAFNNSTSSSSTFEQRGAFVNLGATQMIIDHSIIANNVNGSNPSGWEGEIQGGGWNIYNGTPTAFFTNRGTQTGNIDLDATGESLNLDPQLSTNDPDLSDSFVPPPTHALLPGSVAIDHGRNSGGSGTNFPSPPSTDSRGVTRPQGTKVDVGSYELFVPNMAPTADAGGPYTAPLDETSVLVNASGSSDPDPGDQLAYAWDLNNNGSFTDAFVAAPSFSLQSMGINTVGTHTIRVQVTDLGGLQDVDTTTITVTAGQVVGREVFYNNSSFDGNNPAATAADDGAIATDKSALFPGQSSTRNNITGYSRGINGIMVDISGSNQSSSITANDFSFRIGTSNDFNSWQQAPTPSSVVVRQGAGANGSDRVTITWPDNSITNRWLEVNVLATANTGLGSPDRFYFGNAVGDSTQQDSAVVDAFDFNGTRANPHSFLNRATITDKFDHNRDTLVNSVDLALVRDNVTTLATALPMISPPVSLVGEGEAGKSSFVPEITGVDSSSKTEVSDLSAEAYDTDVNGDDLVNQELLLLAIAEGEDSHDDSCGPLESAIDLITDDLLAE